MSGLFTLDPEVSDLGLAIGLLEPDGAGVSLDSGWFSDPGSKLTLALRDDNRRAALVRFAETVLAAGAHTEQDGVTLLPLFDLRKLNPDQPDLVIHITIDATQAAYVEVGLSATLKTTTPLTSTEVAIPLYRASRTSTPVPQAFALLAGGVVRLASDLTFETAEPAPGDFGLAGVSIQVETAFTGTAAPTFELVLKGLHLPGASSTIDVPINADSIESLEQSLLSLVLGVVQQAALGLAGPVAAEVTAALALIGLGSSGGVPPLPISAVVEQGVSAVRDWLVEVMGAEGTRTAWLGALAELLDGHVGTDGTVTIPLGAGPVAATIAFVAVPGPSGHLLVTPTLGITLTNVVAGDIALGLAASIDVLTVDATTGGLQAVPAAAFTVTATGSSAGTKLLQTGPVSVGAVDVGLRLRDGTPQFLLELRDVDIEGHNHPLLDLSTPDAAAAAAGTLAGDVVGAALDLLGAAGTELKALLGLVPPTGVDLLDGERLLTDPLGALATWWHDLIVDGQHVPEVLTHLRNLIADQLNLPQSVTGTGTAADPWSIPVASRLSIDCWLDAGVLAIAPTLSLRVDDLGGGCTVVLTTLRVTLVSLQLTTVGTVTGFGSVHFPLSVDLQSNLRGRGTTEARLAMGPVAVVSDYVGVQATWSPAAGFAVDLAAPNLALVDGTETVPLVLPTIGADGTVTMPDASWDSIENLLGVLARCAPGHWLADLAGLAGWSADPANAGHLLRLANLVHHPEDTLRAWGFALATNPDLLASLTASVARLTGGSTAGLAGFFSGTGTPDDPWLATLGPSSRFPALAVWLTPDGPVLAPSRTGEELQSWRPGAAGLDPTSLAQAVFDEAHTDADAAQMAAGRPSLGIGLQALAGRWVGTDGLVAPVTEPIPDLTVLTQPDQSYLDLTSLDIDSVVPDDAPLPDNAVLLKIAVTADASAVPWAPAADRLIDLTTPGVAPASFTVSAPATGEWVVALASAADASLGVADPSGALGQAARLQQVLGSFAGLGSPIVLIALGPAGHSARLAADAQSAVTHLLTLGTPWSPVTFDTARTGVPADALRLLKALLPPVDLADPDDPDLALGRALVGGFMDAVRGVPAVVDLDVPRPTTGVRAGLTAYAVFGVLSEGPVNRAMTAVAAAGLAGRARARAATAADPPTASHLGIRVPLPLISPPDGHGIEVSGSLLLTLGRVDHTALTITGTPSIRIDLAVGRPDAWLVGGPGTSPVGGALPLELRRITAAVDIGLFGQPSTAEIVLHEGAALGADWIALHVAPTGDATGALEGLPLLPEARAALGALTAAGQAEAAGTPAAVLMSLFGAAGLTDSSGALLPDGLTHLLHDPGAQLRAAVAAPASRAQLLAALHGLLPDLAVTGDTATLTAGPVQASVDLDARALALTASGNAGVLAWSATAHVQPTGAPTISLTLGDPVDEAAALSISSGPLRAQLLRPSGSPIALWPTPDAAGLARLAAVAIPAEAVRLVLEGMRGLDDDVAVALDALTAALGLLEPADADGNRAITAPVRLFEDPGAWLRTNFGGASLDAGKVIDLLEGLKPFVKMAGTPRGTWPITDGVVVTAASGADGPTIGLAVDATTWIAGQAGHASVAAGLTASLTLPTTGAPRPSVEIFIGLPDNADGTSSAQHRKAVHVLVGGTGVQVLLRPSTGNDVELFPHVGGFGSILGSLVGEVLPKALTAVAAMNADAVRTEIAAVVGGAGRGLAVATGTPAVFDGDALRSLAADPGGWLIAHVATVLTELASALSPLVARLPGAPTVTASGSSGLLITVRTVSVELTPSPFSAVLNGTIDGLPVLGTVGLSLALDQHGLTGFGAQLGPAAIDVGGPILRPVLRVSSQQPAGWQAELGLSLDNLPAGADGHQELLARWQEGAGLRVVAEHIVGTTATSDTTPAAIAVAAIEAVLDLVGDWVLGIEDVKTLLAKQIGSTLPKPSISAILAGSVLDETVLPGTLRLRSGLLEGWPDKLATLALNLATAAPQVPVGPFQIGIARTGNVLGVKLTAADAAGFDLTSGGDLSLHLEVDASWIDPAVTPGIVVDLLTVGGTADAPSFVPTPGIEINGVGLRLGKNSGPLIDAGLRLDSVAVHLFGSVLLGSDGHRDFAGGIELELGGLAVPLGGGGGDNAVAQGIMHDAGGSGAPPRPTFSPAVAVQNHGSGTSVSVRAGSGDGPWFLPIQRAFGPVYLEQAGLGVTYQQGVTPKALDMISLYLDGQVSLLGLTAAVDKLRLGYHVSRPIFAASSWEVDVEGFAIASNVGGLTLAGGLRKEVLAPPLTGVEYLGMLKVTYDVYGVDLFGGYAHPTSADGSSFASFFAFGVLHAPIGGVPAFFITGIGIGFGINRQLITPDIDQISTSPFMQALRASGPAPDPMHELETMRDQLAPHQGEYWVAAGISFTSFVLVTGEILVTVQFGDGLEIAILGLARVQLPDADFTLVSIELALLARFSSTEGTLLVQAQLTENSWLLTQSVRLTGGFAFQTWWKGPNAGQVVVTIGGYHPRFQHDGYPVVPRVGLRWQPIDNISIVGETYFALCSEAIMAGLDIEVTAHLGPAHANLSFGGDAIIFFDPFWFSVEAHAEVNVGIRIWLLFGSVDVEVSMGIEVEVSGPPIFVTGHFSVCGVAIPFEFGDQGDPADNALSASDFAAKYLRGDSNAQVVQATVVRGALTAGKAAGGAGAGVDKVPDGSAEHPFRVVPEFQLTFVATAPTETLVLAGPGGSTSTSVAARDLGVAPMYSATLDATLTVTLASEEGAVFGIGGIALTARPPSAFPKGVWGPAPNPDAPVVPTGDTVPASDGLTLDAVLPDSLFSGAPQIDYHQVEPATARKPLPFVTNTANNDQRVADAVALKAAAAVLTAGAPDAAVRYERAARMLAAGGSGRTTVAALRGERSAPPSFGSLADDLVDSPAPVTPPVTLIPVDPTPPVRPRFAPLVKSVVGVPHTQTLAAAGLTTVKSPGNALTVPTPTLAGVRGALLGSAQAELTVRPRAASALGKTVAATGLPPVTRLATGAVAAVANAAPVPAAAARLATMSDALANGATVNEGELTVVTVDGRPAADTPDHVTVIGGATQVIFLGAGGHVLADDTVGADGASATMAAPRGTERVCFVGIGTQSALGGSTPGWSSAQSLPYLGWGAALAGGAVVTAQATRIAANRERGDGGWVIGRELATAAQVVTVFADPVSVVAIVVDDPLGGDAAATLSMRLLDAERVLDATGVALPPKVLVDGVRSILLYAVTTTGPAPGVLVDGCGGGQLAGVLGSGPGPGPGPDASALDALAELLTISGVDAAVAPPLVGGPGSRQVSVTLAAGPALTLTRSVRPPRARAVKKTVATKRQPSRGRSQPR